MHAPPKSEYPVLEPEGLLEYDGFLFGIPTRYGNFPVQWKAFWDKTGSIWAKGGYWGKFAGVFISTGTPGGGQESTAIAAMSTLAHHGIIYVPLGYKATFPLQTNLTEVHGGSPWGAGTFVSFLRHCQYYISFLTIERPEVMEVVSQQSWSLTLRRFRGQHSLNISRVLPLFNTEKDTYKTGEGN